MSENCKRLAAWIVALLIGLPVLYVASFGPVCWLAEREIIPIRAVEVCRPLAWLAARCPDPVRDAYASYVVICHSEYAGVSYGGLMIKDEYLRGILGEGHPMNDFSQ
jgi:hypothetical protein